MKSVELTNGEVAYVDDEDYDLVKDVVWTYHRGYAVSSRLSESGRMHRYIMKQYHNIPDDKVVDHIDGDGLNNKKSNLRICTESHNQMNKRKTKNKRTSIYKGVSFDKYAGKWCASIERTIDGKRKKYNLGLFENEYEASVVYDVNALVWFKEYACINHDKENYSDTKQYEKYIKVNKERKTTSKYKYVCWSKTMKKWDASIIYNGVKHRIGYFENEVEAVKAVNEYIIKNKFNRIIQKIN